MKIILSAKTLLAALKEIEVHIGDDEGVKEIIFCRDTMTFRGKGKSHEIHCDSVGIEIYQQSDVRWVSVPIMLSMVPDQPILLNVTEQNLSITFDF